MALWRRATGLSGVIPKDDVSSPTASFKLGPIYTSPNRPFECVRAQATYQGRLYTSPSAQTRKFLIE
jgi:hypothetical protein